MLPALTANGLTDAQVQLIAGHENTKRREVYQPLSLEPVDTATGTRFDRRNLMRGTLNPAHSCGTLRTFVGI